MESFLTRSLINEAESLFPGVATEIESRYMAISNKNPVNLYHDQLTVPLDGASLNFGASNVQILPYDNYISQLVVNGEIWKIEIVYDKPLTIGDLWLPRQGISVPEIHLVDCTLLNIQRLCGCFDVANTIHCCSLYSHIKVEEFALLSWVNLSPIGLAVDFGPKFYVDNLICSNLEQLDYNENYCWHIKRLHVKHYNPSVNFDSIAGANVDTVSLGELVPTEKIFLLNKLRRIEIGVSHLCNYGEIYLFLHRTYGENVEFYVYSDGLSDKNDYWNLLFDKIVKNDLLNKFDYQLAMSISAFNKFIVDERNFMWLYERLANGEINKDSPFVQSIKTNIVHSLAQVDTLCSGSSLKQAILGCVLGENIEKEVRGLPKAVREVYYPLYKEALASSRMVDFDIDCGRIKRGTV